METSQSWAGRELAKQPVPPLALPWQASAVALVFPTRTKHFKKQGFNPLGLPQSELTPFIKTHDFTRPSGAPLQSQQLGGKGRGKVQGQPMLHIKFEAS